MTIPRIYQSIPLQVGALIELDEKASHHLARVLRMKSDEKITLFNGLGGEYEAMITEIKKKTVLAILTQFHAKEAESPLFLCLAQGIARGEKMDFIIQKAVELGVNEIVPLITERCNVRLDNEREGKRLMHWQAVIISACEQCGRNRLPSVIPPQVLDEWIKKVSSDQCFVLSPHVQNKMPKLSSLTSATLLIGPEGGLSDAEIMLATQYNFLPLNIGSRVLRTETATLAALTLLQSQYGDMS